MMKQYNCSSNNILLMKPYDCSSNNMIVDEIIWLFMKQYDYSWNSITVHIKFQMLSFDIINIHIITLGSQIGEFVHHDLIYYTIETHT